ncbi:MAG TPA: adenylate/guanylate cyclase domain-containing protein [Anaerolineales bacterium]|nr:adenylate/guanylate cyclase domain-containing protein [Anaerolineales bacterium]
MDCPTCGNANPAGAKFCNKCGSPLKSGCPNCGHENPPGARFCNECGTALGTGTAGSTKAAARVQPAVPVRGDPAVPLRSLIPDDFAARLASARAKKEMVGERRIVTMLFCDVKGSTAAAGNLDPEDWAQIINGVFEYMIRPIYKYEGTVARLMGDGILAFFGAPVAHEDDPQRAILAALEILTGFGPHREKLRSEWGLDMNFRVGINTGLVMVGAVGSDLQMEYTALGDAINLAARMEQTAAPGTVQVTGDTYALTAPVFEWEDLGEVEVKGKDERVRIYRPLHKKAEPGRLRGIAGLDAPMIGRRAEFERLQTAVDRLREGSGGIVLITGEAGLGKSRLIEEIKGYRLKARPEQSRRVEGSPQEPSTLNLQPVWSETASLSYETARPYALFQRLLREVYGVREGDSPVEMWEKFLPILERIPPDMADHGRVFEALFATGGQSSEAQPEGEAFKRQLFDLVHDLVTGWTASAPQVIVLDDLHWSDSASIDLLVHLFKLSETQPVLLVCAMRPERSAPAWTAREAAARDYPHRSTEIALTSLSADDTDALVNHLLLVADLPAGLRKRILEKTDGNPFFIEEVVRVLIDNGVVEREDRPDGVRWRTRQDIEDIDIPGSLQSLLTARIDRLEEDARRILQLASVIGRSFYYRVLDTISRATAVAHATAGVRQELDQHLNLLQRAEMIRESARLPELEFAFRHALTQEAAYNTILVRERRDFHRQVGEAVEMLFADRLEEFFPVLAYHFGEARDPRAVRYETLAGDAAFRLYAIPEAASHYRRAVSVLKHDEKSGEETTHLYSKLGRCLELLSEHAAAVAAYEEMLDLARRCGDERMELAALIALGKVHAIPTPFQDSAKAAVYSEQGLELARNIGDEAAESRLLWNSMLIEMYSGHMDRAIPLGERSTDLARSAGEPAQLAHSLHDLGLPYMAVGSLEKSRAVLDEAFTIWRELNNKPMMAENRSNRGIERAMSGCFDEAIQFTDEGFRYADEIDNDWGRANTNVFSALIFLALGEIDTALEIQKTFLPLSRKLGHPGSTFILISRAEMYEFLGADDLALESAEGAVWDSEDFPPFKQIALAVCAKLHYNAGNPTGAAALLEEARGLSHQKTIIHIEIESTFAEAEINIKTGDLVTAEDQCVKMMALIELAGARFYLPRALKLFAEIALARGDLDLAADYLARAAGAAREIRYRAILLDILVGLIGIETRRGNQAAADRIRQECQELCERIAGNIGDPALKETFFRSMAAKGITIA